MNSKLQFGIFGGSFDPPHLGHLEIIKKMMEICDQVYLQVTLDKINQTKGNPTPYLKRCQWLQWSLKDYGLRGPQISHLEMERGLSGYSLHFLETFAQIYPGRIGFFIGKDQMELLNEWVGFPHFLNFAQFYVILRDQEQIHWHHGIELIRSKIQILDWKIPSIASSQIRQNLQEFNKFLTPRVKNDISSS